MTRLLALLIAAFGGTALGYAVHQVLSAKEGAPLGDQIVVAAPVATAGAAAGFGLLTGKARPANAFVAGVLLAVFLGDRLEQEVPALAKRILPDRRTETPA